MDRTPSGRYADLFRDRSFAPFLMAGALQFAAPSAVLVILLFRVALAYPADVRVDYGALALTFLGLSSTIPTLVTMVVSGAYADRYDRGALMRVANLLAMVATAGLAADLILHPSTRFTLPGPSGFYLPEWILLAYPGWALIAATSTLFRPAYNTVVPRLVDRARLGRANGLIYAIAAVASALGTVVVGLLLGVGPVIYALSIPFLLFFGTQFALLFVHVDLSVERPPARRSVWSDAIQGFRYLYRRRDLLQITLSTLVINFLTALALVELALYVASWLGLAEGVYYGAMYAASTAGAAFGFLLIGRIRFEQRAGRVLIGLAVAMGASLIALAMVRTIWLAIPIIFCYGIFPGMFTTVFLSAVQATVPDEKMGRVFAADELGSYALVPVGQWAGGLVTLAIGIQGTYLVAGGAILALGVVMVTSFGALRRMAYRPQASEPATA